jgi:hypothetical protein
LNREQRKSDIAWFGLGENLGSVEEGEDRYDLGDDALWYVVSVAFGDEPQNLGEEHFT